MSTQVVNRGRPEIYAKVNGRGFKFLVDTGASVNIVNAEVASQITAKIQQCSTKLFTFNSEKPLNACGKFTAQLRFKHRNVKCDFVVTEGNCRSVISYATACDLLEFVYSVQEADVICNQYPQLFQGIGKMKDTKVKLHIDNSVVPVSQSHRRIPFHRRKDLEYCLQTLLHQDIIEPVHGPTACINLVVLVPKKENGVRLCIDMGMAIKAIKQERHVMPTFDEVILDLNGTTIFFKVDLKSGYHQQVLSEESRNITTFSTHMGLYHYKRLSFDINAAAEKFQQVIQTAFSDLPNCKNISDDIIIYRKKTDKNMMLPYTSYFEGYKIYV